VNTNFDGLNENVRATSTASCGCERFLSDYREIFEAKAEKISR